MFKIILLSLFLISNNTFAQFNDVPDELKGLEAFGNILPSGESTNMSCENSAKKQFIIPFIKDKILDRAGFNIENAEQVFCYHVAKKPTEFKGYTLNNFAIIDYCGELDNQVRKYAYEEIFTKSPNIITTVSNCKIEPQVMLRFTHGIDFVDVLLSSPCASATVFYAGRYHSFNIKKDIVDNILAKFNNNNTAFNSPGLLKQTVPNAKPNTDKEEELLEDVNRENTPVMSWKKNNANSKKTSTSNKTEDKSEDNTTSKGWKNLNFQL